MNTFLQWLFFLTIGVWGYVAGFTACILAITFRAGYFHANRWTD